MTVSKVKLLCSCPYFKLYASFSNTSPFNRFVPCSAVLSDLSRKPKASCTACTSVVSAAAGLLSSVSPVGSSSEALESSVSGFRRSLLPWLDMVSGLDQTKSSWMINNFDTLTLSPWWFTALGPFGIRTDDHRRLLRAQIRVALRRGRKHVSSTRLGPLQTCFDQAWQQLRAIPRLRSTAMHHISSQMKSLCASSPASKLPTHKRRCF